MVTTRPRLLPGTMSPLTGVADRPGGPVDVWPFREDPPADPRLASAMTFLASRYFPATSVDNCW